MKSIKNNPIFFQKSVPTVRYADGKEVEHQPLAEQSQLTKELIVFVKTTDGKKMVYNSRTISYQNEIYIAPLPNPVHLMINNGIENYNNSISTLDRFKNDCFLEENDRGIRILNIETDKTNQNFNDVIKYKITSVISLITALEAFLNQVIPPDFIYEGRKKGKPYRFNKKQIESSSISFKEKLTDVMSQLKTKPHFTKQHIKTINVILELYEVRKDVIHMKTHSEDWLSLHFKVTGLILDIDLERAIIATKKYINLIKTNFIK